jgi:DNA polymerase-3 subunit gamma/tau
MKNARPPRRILAHGPSGAGKTTLARILARYVFCLNPVGIGDSCGRCANCTKDLDGFWPYIGSTGNRVTEEWQWWKENMSTILDNSHYVVFIDEAQDLDKAHQAEFRVRLEGAQSIAIFTTTHLHMLDDALINRFGVNVYELKRPTTDEVVNHLESLCADLGVKAQRHQLIRVAENLNCDMRKCVDFAYTAHEQTEGGIVTDDYVNMILGLDPAPVSGQSEATRRRSKF